MDKTVAVFKKNKFQEIRVGIREFKGNDLIDIRTWTMTQGTDDMVPTAKGVSMNIHLLNDLKKSLSEVEKILLEKRRNSHMIRDVIDGHSHFMPPEVAQKTMFFKVNWSDIDRQLTVMDENGIAKAVLLYPTSDAHLNMGGWPNLCRIYNTSLAAVVKKYPNRFIGAGIVPVDNRVLMAEELKCIYESGFRVISLASCFVGFYLDDERFFSIYEFAALQNILVHIHPQIMNPIGEDRVKDPLLTPVLEYVFDVSVCIGKMMMSGTFLKFPTVKFVFAHYGGVIPLVKERFDNTYMMLWKRGIVKDL